jgi:hypothetical protein
VIHAYLGYDIGAVQQELVDIASLSKKMSGKSTSGIDFTHCINKEISRQGRNYVTILVKKFFTVLMDKCRPYSMRPSLELHFLVGSTVKMINGIRQTYVKNYFIILFAEYT